MELWDLHYIRRLDDMGFVDALHGRHGSNDGRHAGHDHAQGAAHRRPPRRSPRHVSTACDDNDCGAKH